MPKTNTTLAVTENSAAQNTENYYRKIVTTVPGEHARTKHSRACVCVWPIEMCEISRCIRENPLPFDAPTHHAGICAQQT